MCSVLAKFQRDAVAFEFKHMPSAAILQSLSLDSEMEHGAPPHGLYRECFM